MLIKLSYLFFIWNNTKMCGYNKKNHRLCIFCKIEVTVKMQLTQQYAKCNFTSLLLILQYGKVLKNHFISVYINI